MSIQTKATEQYFHLRCESNATVQIKPRDISFGTVHLFNRGTTRGKFGIFQPFLTCNILGRESDTSALPTYYKLRKLGPAGPLGIRRAGACAVSPRVN